MKARMMRRIARRITEKEFLETRVLNPETGNRVLMKTLQSKPKGTPAHQAYLDARRRWERIKEKSESKTDPKPKPKSPKTRKSLFSESDYKLPKQSSQTKNDPQELLKDAKVAQKLQAEWLNEGKGLDKRLGAGVVRIDTMIEQGHGAKIGDAINKAMDSDKPVVIIGPLKKMDRAEEKCKQRFGGDWSRVDDFVRASVAANSFEELQNVIKELKKSGMKLNCVPLDRFENPTEAGYRDVKLNVEFENGHVGELQLHLKPIMRVKDEAHKLYEEVRTIQAKAQEEGRSTLTAEEQEIVDKANQEMRNMYDKAWQEATGGKKASKNSSLFKVASTKYYNFEGQPAVWKYKEFPKIRQPGKRETVYYDLEEFFMKAIPLRRGQFEEMVGEMERAKTSTKKTRKELIRLAYHNPGMRRALLPVLKRL